MYLFAFADLGYNDSLVTRFPSQSQYVTSSSRVQFGSTPYALQEQQIDNPHQLQSTTYDNRVGLALGPPQSSLSFQPLNSSVQPSDLINPFQDWSQNRDKGVVEDFLSEEEIRLKSHEMLENDDMQHLLRLFSMGAQSSINGPEEGYNFSSYMPSPLPNFSFDEDRSRSGKAVVGWLKIKAAMRWGFFIRKKAAERRAQIVELEDD